jgi:peptide/nickel transport system substrate-binding protein
MTGTSTVTAGNLKDVQSQVPGAVCSTTGTMVTGVVLMNHKVAPFDNPKVRRAISLALDRNAFVASLQGGGRPGCMMMSPPYGHWGLTPAQLEAVPGFGKNVEANRAEARKLMAEAGYGPGKPLKTTFIVRTSSPAFINGATLAADQLRSIYIEGAIEPKEYTVFTGQVIKGAYQMAFETSGSAIDDPDVVLSEHFRCASIRNYTKYCHPEMEAKIDEQSATLDQAKRKQLVQAIDLKLNQDVARAAVYHSTSTACWHPYVKGYVRSLNGIYTHHRMEDVWLDK